MRALLIAIILAVWAFLGWCYYQDANECCADNSAVTEEVSKVTKTETGAAAAVTGAAATAASKVTGPLLFDWSSSDPILDDDTWPERKRTLLAGLRDNQKMEITGLYRADEANNSTFENLGIARANEVRKLFTELGDDRFRLLGKVTNDDLDRENPFIAANFANRTETKTIKETEDRTLIYFPFNSTNKLNDSEVENYLNDVATRVKASGERVILTGHTDKIGSDASNMILGQWRSDVVQNYLISRGVSASKITAQSKGESAPIADNNTDAGRAKNRRTELQIVK